MKLFSKIEGVLAPKKESYEGALTVLLGKLNELEENFLGMFQINLKPQIVSFHFSCDSIFYLKVCFCFCLKNKKLHCWCDWKVVIKLYQMYNIKSCEKTQGESKGTNYEKNVTWKLLLMWKLFLSLYVTLSLRLQLFNWTWVIKILVLDIDLWPASMNKKS